VEGKFRSGTWFWVGIIREAVYFPRAFVDKRKWVVVEVLEFRGGIISGLVFVNRKPNAFFGSFGFDDSNRFFVYKQNVISGAYIRQVFAHGDPECSAQVHFCFRLNDPATGEQLLVSFVAGELFRILVGYWLSFDFRGASKKPNLEIEGRRKGFLSH